MHYRNGREAKNGDKVVSIGYDGKVNAVGVLYDLKQDGGNFCNGIIAPIQNTLVNACLCDCLHVDDVAEMLKEMQMDKRPQQ